MEARAKSKAVKARIKTIPLSSVRLRAGREKERIQSPSVQEEYKSIKRYDQQELDLQRKHVTGHNRPETHPLSCKCGRRTHTNGSTQGNIRRKY
jgi:hypothetical protein